MVELCKVSQDFRDCIRSPGLRYLYSISFTQGRLVGPLFATLAEDLKNAGKMPCLGAEHGSSLRYSA